MYIVEVLVNAVWWAPFRSRICKALLFLWQQPGSKSQQSPPCDQFEREAIERILDGSIGFDFQGSFLRDRSSQALGFLAVRLPVSVGEPSNGQHWSKGRQGSRAEQNVSAVARRLANKVNQTVYLTIVPNSRYGCTSRFSNDPLDRMPPERD